MQEFFVKELKDMVNVMYLCKIASLEEMNRKWDYEIEQHVHDRKNWIIWKQHSLENFQKGLVGDGVVYLSAFRTIAEYQGKGYFSKLIKFMLDDLKQKGFARTTLGVEPAEETNRKIYAHYGFTEYIKSATETYPDGTAIEVDYYGKTL